MYTVVNSIFPLTLSQCVAPGPELDVGVVAVEVRTAARGGGGGANWGGGGGVKGVACAGADGVTATVWRIQQIIIQWLMVKNIILMLSIC